MASMRVGPFRRQAHSAIIARQDEAPNCPRAFALMTNTVPSTREPHADLTDLPQYYKFLHCYGGYDTARRTTLMVSDDQQTFDARPLGKFDVHACIDLVGLRPELRSRIGIAGCRPLFKFGLRASRVHLPAFGGRNDALPPVFPPP